MKGRYKMERIIIDIRTVDYDNLIVRPTEEREVRYIINETRFVDVRSENSAYGKIFILKRVNNGKQYSRVYFDYSNIQKAAERLYEKYSTNGDYKEIKKAKQEQNKRRIERRDAIKEIERTERLKELYKRFYEV